MWIDTHLTELQKYTDRNIIVRKKDTKVSLQKQLENCHAIVTHQSTAAIEAILAGVPSFCDNVSAANEVSESLYENIETPHYPDDDLIELIYDDSSPGYIQRIWGKDNDSIKLDAYNENFYHWRLFDKNYANGFYWGDWSFSLPDLMMIWTKGNTHGDTLGSGITSTTLYTKCKRVN